MSKKTNSNKGKDLTYICLNCKAKHKSNRDYKTLKFYDMDKCIRCNHTFVPQELYESLNTVYRIFDKYGYCITNIIEELDKIYKREE